MLTDESAVEVSLSFEPLKLGVLNNLKEFSVSVNYQSWLLQ